MMTCQIPLLPNKRLKQFIVATLSVLAAILLANGHSKVTKMTKFLTGVSATLNVVYIE